MPYIVPYVQSTACVCVTRATLRWLVGRKSALGQDRLRLGLPGRESAQLSLALPPYPRLSYCGKGDPGSTVVVSPFEPTLTAVLRQR